MNPYDMQVALLVMAVACGRSKYGYAVAVVMVATQANSVDVMQIWGRHAGMRTPTPTQVGSSH